MIELHGSFKTENEGWLFRNIEISLFLNGWTCLLGPSGVGKTTILRILAGLDTHGEFIVKSTQSNGHSFPACSYMAQQDLLLPWLNILDNVCLGAVLRGEKPERTKAKSMIEKVGLIDHINKHPRQLSGGMRQRTALARTLMENRSIVLLDEPFSALDARTRAEMQELAHELLADKTVMLVTHDPAEAARMGDRNLILDESGLTEAPHKKSPGISKAESPETLQLQAGLLSKLRKVPA